MNIKFRGFIVAIGILISAAFLAQCQINPFYGIGEADAIPPTIHIIYPLDGSAYSPQQITIRGTASDNEKIKDVLIKIGGGSEISLGALNEWEYKWNAQNASLGKHTITATAVDETGNRTSRSIEVTLDYGAPSVTITKPLTNEYVSGAYTFEGTAVDDNAIVSIDISFDAQSWQPVPFTLVQTTNYTWATNIDTSELNDGFNYVYVRAFDNVGNMSLSSRPFYIVNTPLSIEILSPTNGQIVNGTVNIIGSVEGLFLHSIAIRFNAGDWISIPPAYNFSYKWDTGDFNGTNSIEIMAVNKGNKTNTDSLIVVVDRSIPTISISTPADNSYVKGEVSIQGISTDELGLMSLKMSTNNGLSYNITIADNIGSKSYNWEYNLDTTRLPEGQNNIWFRVTDLDNKVQSTVIRLNVENTTPNFVINSPRIPDDDSYPIILESYVFSGAISSTFPPQSMDIKVGTGGWVSAELSDFSWRYTVYFNPADPVTNEIGLRVVSKVSVTNTTNFTVVVDKELPVIEIEFPSANSYISGKDLVSSWADLWGTITDDTGVDKVYISFDNASFKEVQVSNDSGVYYWYTNNFNPSVLPEGQNTLYVRAYDKATKSITRAVVFYVDKTDPVVNIVSPTNDTTVGLNFTIQASATDNFGVGYMQIKIGEKVVASNFNLTSISYNFATNLGGQGAYVILVEAKDRAGNNKIGQVTVVVNENPARIDNFAISQNKGDNNYLTGIVEFTGRAYASTPVSDVYYRFSHQASWTHFITNAGLNETNWVFEVNTSGFPQGSSALHIRPTDTLGGFVDFVTNIYIDNTAPTVTYINPEANYDAKGGLFPVSVRINDNVSLKSFKLLGIGNGSTNELTNVANITPLNTKERIYTAAWDLLDNGYADGGTNTITSIVVDRANITNIVSIPIIVSNEVPILTVNTPAQGTYVPANIFVSGRAVREDDGIDNTQIRIGGGSFVTADVNNFSGNGETNDFSHTINASGLSEGSQIITVRATASNNTYTENSISVTLDKTPPSVAFTKPTSGTKQYGTIAIEGTASDNYGIDSLIIWAESGGETKWGTNSLTLDGNTWATSWNTSTLPVGNVNIIVEATDYAGNTTRKTNSITVAPYITSLSKSSTWIGDSITINGHNFGTEALIIRFGTNVTAATGNNTSINLTIPANAKTGYLSVEVNGIRSINSNWINIWEIVDAGTIDRIEEKIRFAVGNDKAHFVIPTRIPPGQGGYARNYIRYQYNTESFNTDLFFELGPNQADSVIGNAISIGHGDYSGIMAVSYGLASSTHFRVTVFTNDGGWTTLNTGVVDATVSLAGTPLTGIKVAPNGHIHTVYSDRANSRIRYAVSTDNGASWTVSTAITGVSFHPTVLDAQPSIDVDNANNVHISFYDHTDESLYYARLVGAEWQKELVASDGINGQYSSIKVDSSGTIHISYFNGNKADLMYAYKTSGGSWVRQIVDDSSLTGQFTGIDIRGSEKAISYFNISYNNAWLAYYSGTVWRRIQVPQFAGMNDVYGKYSGVNFTSTGEIWMGFIDNANRLWLAKYKK
jgi:hypothetical protein